jgi:hypothetical protein
MSTYKITNITNLAGKRDLKYNSILDIDYIDEMTKKTIKVKPGNTIYLTVSTLPLSIHRLRVKGLITVTEIGLKELNDAMGKIKPMAIKVEENVELKTDSKKIIKKKPQKTE